jgi:DNA-directed RNA polymerase subunit beta'
MEARFERVVTEFRGSARSKEDLRPRITLLDEKSGEAARYMLSPGAMLSASCRLGGFEALSG